MFTGIIKATGVIEKLEPINSGIELVLSTDPDLITHLETKSNLALDGQVFTLLNKTENLNCCLLHFYVSHPNKLATYWLKKRINLERAIRAGEELPGSLFSGIPSGKAQVLALKQIASERWHLEISWHNFLLKYLNPKDQVCLDGILLRITQILDSSIFFELYGDTLKLTNLRERQPGDLINIEVEPMLKKIAQIFEQINKQDNHIEE